MSTTKIPSPRKYWALLELVMGADMRRYLAWNALLAVVLGYSLVPPLIVGYVVDFLSGYRPEQSWSPLYMYSGLLTFLTIGVAIVRLQAKAKLTELAITAAYRARVYGFERLMNQSIQWHDDESTGNKIQRVTTGSTRLEDGLKMLSGDVLSIVVIVCGVLTSFFVANPLFGLLGLSHVTLFFAIQTYFTRRIRGIIEESKQASEDATGVYVEGAANILTIRTLNLQQGITRRVTAKEEAARKLKVRISSLIFWKWRCFQTVQGCILGSFVFVVGRDVLNGGSTTGDMLVLFTYFRSLHESLGDSTGLIDNFIDQIVSVGRLVPIFDEGRLQSVGTAPFPPDWKRVTLRNVSARYSSDRGGLRDFSLTIERGSHIGIVGTSGAGKSTLAKVMMGVQPVQAGTYTIEGVPYETINPVEASNAMSIVLQDCELFNASLADNIAAMRDVPEEDIVEAIRIAGLDDVVEKLEQGIDTVIGEKGYRLSGGERQRLGIARAICKNPDILILDEATSALDARTEVMIHEALLSELGSKTLVIIAHRLSTVRNVDKILVLDDGIVVEAGSPTELLERPSSRFAEMWRLQQRTESV